MYVIKGETKMSEKEMFELTTPQRSIWMMEQFYKGTNINNICATLTINMDVDIEKLNRAINIFVQRNKSFGLNFKIVNGELKQYFTQLKDIRFEQVKLKDKKAVQELAKETVEEIFDIEGERLFKFKLYKLENKYGGFVVMTHHLISDAATMSIIGKEVTEIYSKIIFGEEIEEKEYSYEQYLLDEREYLKSPKFIKDKEYWTETFNTVPEVVTIPTTLENLHTDLTGKSEREEFILNINLLTRISQFCSQNKISNFNFFMAVYAIYLSRVSNLKDFVIGTPILNRTNFKEKHTTGMFINTAPLRIKIEDNIDFISFAKTIAKSSMSMLRYQKYSYQLLLEELRKSNNNLPTLYDVMLSYQVTKANDRESRIPYEVEWIPSTTISNGIYVHFHDNDDEGTLNVAYDYQVEKYTKQDVTNMHNRILYIIYQVLENQNCLEKDIEIVTPEEKNQILNVFNDTYADYPRDKTIVDLFEEQVEKTPDNVAVVCGDEQITYKELNEKANCLANYLEQKGIKSGATVGIRIERSIYLVISIIACIKVGITYVLIENSLPKERVDYILKDSGSKALITSNNLNKEKFNIDNIIWEERILKKSYPEIRKSNEKMCIIYTSGSTGEPKGVMLRQSSFVNFFFAINTAMKLERCEKFISHASVSFDMFALELYCSLLNGKTLYLTNDIEQKDIISISEIIIKNDIDYILTTPSKIELMLSDENISKSLSCLKVILMGGETLTSSLYKRIKEKTDANIYNGYGPTETTICCTVKQIDNEKEINIGKPLNNSEVYILDSDSRICPVGIIGELCIAGEGLALGYMNKKELTEKAFTIIEKIGKKVYKTGDLAKFKSNGEIEYIGRRDFQVKLHGQRIELGEIEKQISDIPSMRNVCVCVKKSENREMLCAYYTANENIDYRSIKLILENKLPQYMIPTYFCQLAKMPITINGKIDRNKLPEPILKHREINEYSKPKNKIQEELMSIFKEVLSVDQVDLKESFFDLGGDSLLAINLMTKIYNKLNAKLTIRDIFLNPSIAELEKLVRADNNKEHEKQIPKAEQKDEYQLSTAQKRIYYASSVGDSESMLYNIAGGIILEGRPNILKLENSINELIKRHSILRTKFELINGEILQKIEPTVEFRLKVTKVGHNDVDVAFSSFAKPFKLLDNLLYRFELIELKDGKNLFVMNIHHSICDGTSSNILLEELCRIYNGEKLEENDLEYKDFAEWECKKIKNDDFHQTQEFWRKQFEGEIPVLNLPTTYKRKNESNFEGDSKYLKINKELKDKLVKLANNLNCTLYMVCLAAYYILLEKYTSQKDIIIGIPVSGRYTPELENIVGMFVNTLALRSKINNEYTFKQYIKEIKRLCVNSLENQEYPIEQLTDKLKIQREDGKRRLFDTMFIFQNNGYPEFKIDGIETKYYIPKSNISKFDISLELIPNDENSLDMRVEYRTELFDEEYAKDFGEHYLKILQETCDNTDLKIKDINILTEKEKNILKEFNNTEEPYSKDKSVIKLFESQAQMHPNSIAVVFENKKITYKDLNEKANALAGQLILQKVEPKNVVGILLSRSENVVISMLAVLKTGCAYMLIDPSLPNDRIQYMLSDSKATILITEETVKYIKFKNKIFLNKLQNCKENLNIKDDIENPFSIIYTSGSTGKPKGVILKNKGVINVVLSHQILLNTDECDNFLSMSTVSFDMFMVETMVPLLTGKTVILTTEEEQKIPVYTSKLMIKNNVDFMLTTPSRIELFLTNKLYKCIEKLKIIQLGGEVFTLELKERLQKHTKATLYNGYGPTEITACCAMKKVEDYVSIGKPLCNTKIYILSEDNNICPINIPGEICIAGDGVSLGYINNPELTSKSFIKNPFGNGNMYKTGDIGKINSNGELKYIDRKDSQIKIRGLRVELSEIEKQILSTIQLKGCTVIYKKDKGYISAFICADEKVDISEARKKLSQKIPLYMVPKYITQLDKLPLTSNGKIDKRKLEEYNDEHLEEVKYVEPKSEKEKLFCSVWEKLLNTKIGVENDVFECGADSLLAIKFKTELLAYNIDVSYSDLFRYKTVRSLCRNSNIKEADDSDNYDYTNINKILEKNNVKNIKNIEHTENNNVLLFGSTGFVGMHIIYSFIKNDTGNIYCIVRDKNNKSAQERFMEILHFYFEDKLDKYIGKRIFIVKANILKENFELSNKNYKYLAENIDIVINSAAMVKHYGDEIKFIETNVNSTKNIIGFCMENKKRLIQISSLSVSGNASIEGNAQDRDAEEKINFTEQDLYNGQNLTNVYIKSKFKAERIILENIEKGLDAQILRLGNITSRMSDGKFQINPNENAFANKLKSMIKLGMLPQYLLNSYVEFTPVDICADAIIKIMQNNIKGLSVFHVYDNEHVYFKELEKYLQESNIKLKIVENEDFVNEINKHLNKNDDNILLGIINDLDKDKKLSYSSNVSILSEFTRKFLYQVGFIWPKIGKEYILKYIEYLKEINFI